MATRPGIIALSELNWLRNYTSPGRRSKNITAKNRLCRVRIRSLFARILLFYFPDRRFHEKTSLDHRHPSSCDSIDDCRLRADAKVRGVFGGYFRIFCSTFRISGRCRVSCAFVNPRSYGKFRPLLQFRHQRQFRLRLRLRFPKNPPSCPEHRTAVLTGTAVMQIPGRFLRKSLQIRRMLTVLVNKYFTLPDDYVPELVLATPRKSIDSPGG